jgi:SAM-dependent methyltransferase
MNPEFEETPCLVCGANDFLPYSRKGQFGLPTHVVICRACGFSYLNPRWTKERYDTFYSKEYDKYYRPEIITQNDSNYRYKPVQQIITRLKERSILPPFNNVLDIGSGMGHALVYIKENLAPQGNYFAIEPSENCRAFLSEKGIHYLSPDVYSDWHKNQQGRFDFVIMRHVLEHFHDPLSVLERAREVLSDDGILYVGVPDAFHPTKPLRSHFFRIVHISYFSKVSLSNLLKKAGLEIISGPEADQLEKSEIFALCKKGIPENFKPDSAQFKIQKEVYETAGQKDWYYELKARLIAVLRKTGLLK